MMKFLMPGLLIVNLLITGGILGLALTGRIVAPAVVEPAADAQAGKDGAAAEKPKPSFYFELKPEIVVNFKGTARPRYMQLSFTLVTYDEAAIAALKLHSPVMRNDLLLLLSDLDSGSLLTREGKDAMRKMVLGAVRKIMLERYGSEAVEDVYLTRFVMQ